MQATMDANQQLQMSSTQKVLCFFLLLGTVMSMVCICWQPKAMVKMMTTSWLVINRMEIACPEKKDTMALNLSLDSSIPKMQWTNGINVCKWNSESDHPVWKNDDHERVGYTPVVLQIKWDIEQEEKITWPTTSVKPEFKWISKQSIDCILLSFQSRLVCSCHQSVNEVQQHHHCKVKFSIHFWHCEIVFWLFQTLCLLLHRHCFFVLSVELLADSFLANCWLAVHCNRYCS